MRQASALGQVVGGGILPAPEVPSLRSSAAQAGMNAVLDSGALRLRDRPEHSRDKSARRGACRMTRRAPRLGSLRSQV